MSSGSLAISAEPLLEAIAAYGSASFLESFGKQQLNLLTKYFNKSIVYLAYAEVFRS